MLRRRSDRWLELDGIIVVCQGPTIILPRLMDPRTVTIGFDATAIELDRLVEIRQGLVVVRLLHPDVTPGDEALRVVRGEPDRRLTLGQFLLQLFPLVIEPGPGKIHGMILDPEADDLIQVRQCFLELFLCDKALGTVDS